MDADSAFLLITCEIGQHDKIKEQLEKMDEVKEVSITDGVYDLVTHVQTESKDHFKSLLERIRHIDNVRATLTLTQIENP